MKLQLRTDEGEVLHDVDVTQYMNSPDEFIVDIMNQGYRPDENFMLWSHSGAVEDIPDHIMEHLDDHHLEQLEPGYLISIVDGEVVEISEFGPYHIHVDI